MGGLDIYGGSLALVEALFKRVQLVCELGQLEVEGRVLLLSHALLNLSTAVLAQQLVLAT